MFYFPLHIWDVILPIDELHDFSRWLKPPTRILMNSGWPRYHQTRALYTTGVHILDCFSCGELWPVITTCHQEASSAPEQLSIPSQRDEEFKRCPQQILGTVVAVNRITGFNIRSTPPLCIYIYESSHDIPIKHDIPIYSHYI